MRFTLRDTGHICSIVSVTGLSTLFSRALRKMVGESKKPRSEPEIIPPDDARRRQSKPRMHVFVDTRGTERVYIGKPSPLGIILITLITAILIAVLLVFLLGTFLIVAPLLALIVAVAIIVGIMRGFFLRAP